MEKTNNFIRTYLMDKTVVLGCSYGPDSMCLLDILLKLNKKITIIVAHINHNIRKISDSEAEFIKEYCQEKKVILEEMLYRFRMLLILYYVNNNNQNISDSEINIDDTKSI